jgi:hypothetical protein
MDKIEVEIKSHELSLEDRMKNAVKLIVILGVSGILGSAQAWGADVSPCASALHCTVIGVSGAVMAGSAIRGVSRQLGQSNRAAALSAAALAANPQDIIYSVERDGGLSTSDDLSVISQSAREKGERFTIYYQLGPKGNVAAYQSRLAVLDRQIPKLKYSPFRNAYKAAVLEKSQIEVQLQKILAGQAADPLTMTKVIEIAKQEEGSIELNGALNQVSGFGSKILKVERLSAKTVAKMKSLPWGSMVLFVLSLSVTIDETMNARVSREIDNNWIGHYPGEGAFNH